MQPYVLRYGAIAGAIMTIPSLVSFGIWEEPPVSYSVAEIIGYATILLSLSLVYFGVRRYRDTVLGGSISFGKAFGAGMLITLVASVIFSLGVLLIFGVLAPDFAADYMQAYLEQLEADGASPDEVAAERAQIEGLGDFYSSPFFQALVMFLTVMPIGAVISLVSAALLCVKASSIVPEDQAPAPGRGI